MTVRIRQVAGGVLIPVRVQPRAARNEVAGEHSGAVKLRLTAPPVEGEANRACILFLAKVLDVAPGKLSIVGGEHSRDKVVRAEGLDAEAVCRALGLQ